MSESLVDRVRRLRTAVAVHKSAVGHHRRELQACKAALHEAEAECARHGISLIIINSTGEGVSLHGQKRPA